MNEEIELYTWEFVRIMVGLEDRGRRGALWRKWEKRWLKLDQELEKLAQKDMDAYSALMLQNRISLELPTPGHKAELIAILKYVIKQMHSQLTTPGGIPPGKREDISFESRELKKILTKLDLTGKQRSKKEHTPAGKLHNRTSVKETNSQKEKLDAKSGLSKHRIKAGNKIQGS